MKTVFLFTKCTCNRVFSQKGLRQENATQTWASHSSDTQITSATAASPFYQKNICETIMCKDHPTRLGEKQTPNFELVSSFSLVILTLGLDNPAKYKFIKSDDRMYFTRCKQYLLSLVESQGLISGAFVWRFLPWFILGHGLPQMLNEWKLSRNCSLNERGRKLQRSLLVKVCTCLYLIGYWQCCQFMLLGDFTEKLSNSLDITVAYKRRIQIMKDTLK